MVHEYDLRRQTILAGLNTIGLPDVRAARRVLCLSRHSSHGLVQRRFFGTAADARACRRRSRAMRLAKAAQALCACRTATRWKISKRRWNASSALCSTAIDPRRISRSTPYHLRRVGGSGRSSALEPHSRARNRWLVGQRPYCSCDLVRARNGGHLLGHTLSPVPNGGISRPMSETPAFSKQMAPVPLRRSSQKQKPFTATWLDWLKNWMINH